jgi:hypothetical protein
MGRIKIRISTDCHGWMYVDPVSARVDSQIRDRLAEMGRPAHPGDSLLFVQNDCDQEAFLEDLPLSAARDVRGGWTVVVLYDSWAFGQMCGCDW